MEQVSITVPLGKVELSADVSLPDHARGAVLFAHGSGSSRHSPRNRHVADVLNRGSIGTILIDLLTEEEEAIDVQTAELRFDISLLGHAWPPSQTGSPDSPVSRVWDWAISEPAPAPLPPLSLQRSAHTLSERWSLAEEGQTSREPR